MSRDLLHEALTTALYVSVTLLASFAAVPDGEDVPTLQIIWGTTIGLAVAHWFAFGLSARYVTGSGKLHKHDGEVILAQLGGAVLVACVVSVPVVLLDRESEHDVVRLLLAAFISLVAYEVARSGGGSRARSAAYAGVTLLLGLAIALVKNLLIGH